MPVIVRNIFEEYVKERFNLSDCIAVNNGTSALIAPLWSMELEEGDGLVAHQEADRLVLEKPNRVKKRLKARFPQVRVERALVDELIPERCKQFCLEDSRLESV